ncbi:hypothetical protein [Virgibacillus sp. CBA3643]|uniref:hypothetical protein n=1 Tax=Virgibacillus sp. CBA3643 TaxID=2942278 RepID=UPI0035A2DB6B
MVITREEETRFPTFLNHKSARLWFKEKYGKHFVMVGSEVIDGEKVYFYNLVLDRETYLEGREKLQSGEMVTGFDFINSYQAVEVYENGNIHVVH